MIIRQEQMAVLGDACGGQPVVPCNKCQFGVDIVLGSHTDGTVLTPLGISYFDELASGKTKTKDYVIFEITIKINDVESLSVEITDSVGGAPRQIYFKDLEPQYRNLGRHIWQWDGYGNDDILDTRVLKSPDLILEIRAQLCGVVKSAKINFRNVPGAVDFLDVRINRGATRIDVDWRINLVEGTEDGVGTYDPPEALKQDWDRHLKSGAPSWKSYLPGHPMRHARLRTFSDLKLLASYSVLKFWSRDNITGYSVKTAIGVCSLSVNAVVTETHSMVRVALNYNTNSPWGRSSNPGSIRGVVSLFGNVVPKRIIYNVGWIQESGGIWAWKTPDQADEDFVFTAAHELGHEVLAAYGNEGYSYGHKGTSDMFGNASGSPACPTTGEVDLMKYYNDAAPLPYDPLYPEWLARVLHHKDTIASEVDALSLVWLARVRFAQ